MKVCLSLRDQDFHSTKSIGIYNVSIGLAYALADNPNVKTLILLANVSLEGVLRELSSSPKVEIIGGSDPVPKGIKRLLWDQWGIAEVVNSLDVDWLILPKGFPPVVRWFKAKVCCYIHDNIFQFYADKGWAGIPVFEKYYFPWCYKRAVRKADLIITNSQFTCDEVIASGRKMAAQKVGIGFDCAADVLPKSDKKGILIFTSPQPHKLTGQSIQWLERWKLESGNQVMIYGVGGMAPDLAWPTGEDWVKMPRISDQELEDLRRKAEVLVYFSAYEGFGMPPCEAVQSGVIPLASDIPPHRETLPMKCLFPNDDYQVFKSRLNHLLEEKPAISTQIDSWEDVAERVLKAMHLESHTK